MLKISLPQSDKNGTAYFVNRSEVAFLEPLLHGHCRLFLKSGQSIEIPNSTDNIRDVINSGRENAENTPEVEGPQKTRS